MPKTGKPIAAGVLQLVSSALSLITFFILLISSLVLSLPGNDWYQWYDGSPGNMDIAGLHVARQILIGFAIAAIISGVLSLIGGVLALRRRKWGMALTGSIFSLFPTIALGIAAIILTSLAKGEFDQPKQNQAQPGGGAPKT